MRAHIAIFVLAALLGIAAPLLPVPGLLPAEDLWDLANRHERAERVDAALATYAELVSRISGPTRASIRAHAQLCMVLLHLRKQQFAEAEALLQRVEAYARLPESLQAEIVHARARLYIERGDAAQALTLLSQRIPELRTPLRNHYTLHALHEAVLDAQPDRAPAERLAIVEAAQRDFDEDNESWAGLSLRRADVLVDLDRREEAHALLQKLIDWPRRDGEIPWFVPEAEQRKQTFPPP